jgi:hypothetical protein
MFLDDGYSNSHVDIVGGERDSLRGSRKGPAVEEAS